MRDEEEILDERHRMTGILERVEEIARDGLMTNPLLALQLTPELRDMILVMGVLDWVLGEANRLNEGIDELQRKIEETAA